MCSFWDNGEIRNKCNTSDTKWLIESYIWEKEDGGDGRKYYRVALVEDNEWTHAVCHMMMEYFDNKVDAKMFVKETKIEEYEPKE